VAARPDAATNLTFVPTLTTGGDAVNQADMQDYSPSK